MRAGNSLDGGSDGENQAQCRQACRLHEDGFERNQCLKFSKIIEFFDPAITDVLGHESGESRIARYHESARCNTIGDVEKFAGPIAYPRIIVGDHITRICETARLLTDAKFSNSAAGLDIRAAADSRPEFSIARPQQNPPTAAGRL